MKRPVLVVFALWAVLIGPGCGGKSSARLASATSTTASTASDGGATSTTTAKAQRSTTTTAKAQRSTTTTAGPSDPPPYTTNPAVKATTDKACVHPTETQGLTVRGSPDGDTVYDTVYSDNTDELNGQYGTGFGKGRNDANGVFHDTWVVSPKAPPGPAYINVATVYEGEIVMVRPEFVIKPLGQPC